MSTSRSEIDRVVKEVLSEMGTGRTPEGRKLPPPPAPGSDGVFADVESAVQAARAAQRALSEQSLTLRYDIVSQMRVMLRRNVELLSWMAREETGLGRYEDKIDKNLLVTNKSPGPEDLEPIVQTGDHGLTRDGQPHYCIQNEADRQIGRAAAGFQEFGHLLRKVADLTTCARMWPDVTANHRSWYTQKRRGTD